jgi:hypothetical protein
LNLSRSVSLIRVRDMIIWLTEPCFDVLQWTVARRLKQLNKYNSDVYIYIHAWLQSQVSPGHTEENQRSALPVLMYVHINSPVEHQDSFVATVTLVVNCACCQTHWFTGCPAASSGWKGTSVHTPLEYLRLIDILCVCVCFAKMATPAATDPSLDPICASRDINVVWDTVQTAGLLIPPTVGHHQLLPPGLQLRVPRASLPDDHDNTMSIANLHIPHTRFPAPPIPMGSPTSFPAPVLHWLLFVYLLH